MITMYVPSLYHLEKMPRKMSTCDADIYKDFSFFVFALNAIGTSKKLQDTKKILMETKYFKNADTYPYNVLIMSF